MLRVVALRFQGKSESRFVTIYSALPMRISGTLAPSARIRHTAVWTGSKFLVWGGQQSGAFLGDGAAYDPANDSWTAIPSSGAPVARANHVAVWTGTEMLIYGGEDNTGAISSGAAFDPAKNKWRTLDTATASMAKYWCSDLQCKVMDECVQLHGGVGFTWDYDPQIFLKRARMNEVLVIDNRAARDDAASALAALTRAGDSALELGL